MPDTAPSYPFLAPPTSDDFLGSLAHYRVVSELGRGGMGFVFHAEDAKLKRSVALKVMNQKISEVAGSRKRFISEARAMAAIHHDNVATIFEVGESNGTPFMAMEMLKGETLEALNRSKKKFDYETIIKYATDIARGLEAAHVRGIVHRDIKPANIWIEAEVDRVKILDFGLALASTPVDHLAGRGSVVGTPGYLSPEQARSDPLDNRSDLYSLGVVLYEMCTGRLPIQSKSVHQQLISILAHRPKPIEEVNPEIPKPLRDMIHKLLRKEPRSRFQSAGLLEEELKEVEEACHQQSEVAQAINRLKAGLDQVTTPAAAKTAAAKTVVAAPAPKAIENGFAGIDEIPAPAMDPLAMPVGPYGQPGSLSGAHASVQPRAASAHRRVRMNNSRSSSGSSSGLPKYLPLIVLACLVLVTLPLMAYFFGGFGRSDGKSVVESPPAENLESTHGSKAEPKTVTPQVKANSEAKKAKRKSKQKSDEAKKKKKKRKKQPKQSSEPTGKAKNRIANAIENSDRSANQPSDAVVMEKPSLEEGIKQDPANADSSTQKYNGPTRVISIATIGRRGADSMVQDGSKENFGLRPSLGVRTKDGVEIDHTYLRFDLSKLKGMGNKIQDARLVLHLFGGKEPVGAVMRVIGIKDVGLWPEDRISWTNSPSNEQSPKPLSQFPVLIETTLSKSSLREHPGQLHLTGPKLVNFLRQEGDTVTFAIAGKWDERLLRFASREKTEESSPTLQVVVPK